MNQALKVRAFNFHCVSFFLRFRICYYDHKIDCDGAAKCRAMTNRKEKIKEQRARSMRTK
ncbi:hypothetical protein C9I92_02985 [Photobacterium ganghwense]|uniref:Uncharacterized protein n=1 Tax=Photobacterium ganghwense TaxID=320778 RepID=A0A0J1HGK0_9GAMM|nr:hypothetical protein ABT57_04620 [Photobacterium ganghwense]PSU11090.1 hypothetical protein C9I92_02985 [Photobacterium ganghwense]